MNILGSVAQISPPELRDTLLFTIFKSFYDDDYKFVKKAALMQIGEFIFALRGRKIPNLLLELYSSLSDPKQVQDEDVMYRCAYTFPAILLTVGMEEWPRLKVVYDNLIKKDNSDILNTMAASIHEIAKIVGPTITASKLDPIAKHYLKSKKTLNIILSNLHEFLTVLDMEKRFPYLQLLKEIIDGSEYNWRQREIFASHCGDYAKLFDIEKVHETILPIVYDLLEDNVAQVRNIACREYVNVVMQLKSIPEYFGEAVQFLLKLFNSISFRDRQCFILACEGFMCYEQIFSKHFLTQFLTLQKDTVVNVRVTLARALYEHMKISGVLASNVHIVRTIELLKNDKSKEVKESVTEASKEWNKMNEIVISNMEELEKAQEAAGAAVDLNIMNDEESNEELKRQEAEKVVIYLLRKIIHICKWQKYVNLCFQYLV